MDSRSDHQRRLGLALVACVVAGQAALSWAAGTERLSPGRPTVHDLASGGTLVFEVELDTRPWRIVAEQIGIDVVLEIGAAGEDSGVKPLLAVDRPLDRDGAETALLSPESGGAYRVVVRSRDANAPPGRVRLAFEDLSWSTPQERARWAAESAETEAAAAYFQGGGEGRRLALEAYERSLPHWQASGDAERHALAVYSIGVLHRLLGDPPAALAFDTRAAERFRELGEHEWHSSALNEIGLVRVAQGEFQAAREAFDRAVGLLESGADPFRETMSRRNLCLVSLHVGALREGIECYRRAESVAKGAGDVAGDAMALTNSGVAHDLLGEPDEALRSYERALEIQTGAQDAPGQALTLNNLAVLHGLQGDHQRALQLYQRSASIYRSLGNRSRLALALSNIGTAYWRLGEVSRSRSFFERALPLQREVENRRDQILTLSYLAGIAAAEGDSGEAEQLYAEALALARAIGDRSSESRVLRRLGRHQLQAGDHESAAVNLRASLEIALEVGSRRGQAEARLGLAEVAMAAGGAPPTEQLSAALRTFESIGGAAGAARTLVALARVARARGELVEAQALVERAIAAIESIRARITSPELKAAYLAGRRQAHELDISLWMERHRAEPGRGFDARALEASERARARSLLELLSEAGSGARNRLTQEQSAARRRLQFRLDRAERGRVRLVSGPHESAELSAKEAEIESILAEMDLLDAEIRESMPALSVSVKGHSLDAGEIQELLDRDTLLLVYALARERSFLWLVSSEKIESHELPPQRQIEAMARRSFDDLSTLDPARSGAVRESTAELGRALLGAVAGRLDRKRLVVVADGALHHVPFAALPQPQGAARAGEPLVASHEIARAPSASSVAAQRTLIASRRPAAPRALVIADPVYDRADPRVSGASPQARAAADDELEPVFRSGLERLARLPSTRREAESISALGGPGRVTTVLGFEARRSTLLGSQVREYGIVHLAAHGVINDRSPRLSGLALSRVDREGSEVDGFLRLDDIYALELHADLVVLSGCRTASGREIRGEGLLGLTQGFMSAGAARVMASLWQVQDRATAELMAAFYRALWVEGQSPVAALRTAQLSLWRQRRWRDPYFWAGFVILGEWGEWGEWGQTGRTGE